MNESILDVKGVGEKLAEQLAFMHIYETDDMLEYFPYRYDIYEEKPLQELVHDEKVTIKGKVIYDPSLTFFGKKKSRLSFTVEVEGVAVKAIMFNRAFAKKQIQQGQDITLTGK